jgi:ribosomal protein S18 acetylase RimI-like enzyme
MIRIEKANIAQLNTITTLYRACAKEMVKQGFENWGDFYPPVPLIQGDIESETLFCLLEDEQLLGVIALDAVPPVQYEKVQWQYPTTINLIVHRLAIAVEAQKNGYAKKLMEFAALYAQKNGYTAIRLDAYSINERLLKFYRRLGYQSTKETISLGAKWKHPFICFEKVLISSK